MRPAYRHWLRSGKGADTHLIAALWRADFSSGYRAVVEHCCVAWVRALQGDWSAVEILVDVAFTQAFVGDSAGAEHTQTEARRVAEEGAREILENPRGRPPEVAVWLLAHLIALEHGLGREEEARAMLARCRALLDVKPTSRVGKCRVTTRRALATACADAGWGDAAQEFGADARTLARSRWRDVAGASLAAFADRLADGTERLEFLLATCRRLPVQV